MNKKIAAVAIIENKSDELLLLKRDYHPVGFTLTGGMINIEKESIIQGLIREIKEEIGVNIKEKYLTLMGTEFSVDGIEVYIYKSSYKIDNDVKLSNEHTGFIFVKNLNGIILSGNTDAFLKYYTFDSDKLKLGDIITFGKYKGEEFEDIIEDDLNYFSWLKTNVKELIFSKEVIDKYNEKVEDYLDARNRETVEKNTSHVEIDRENIQYNSDCDMGMLNC